jgi:hypothetical protein
MSTVADQEEPIPANELRAEDLNDEITRKYDPERLLKLIGKRAGKGESLDLAVRNKYEQRFGVDLSHVRVYSGEFAEEFNKKRDAFAVTVGATGMILMGGSPEKSMATSAGQALLAHELTHVAQAQRHQGGGLHRKATFDSGMPFSEEHEVEAEEHEAAVQHEAAHAAPAAAGKGTGSKESLEQATEEVKAKVLAMAAEAARSYSYRNGSTRRP